MSKNPVGLVEKITTFSKRKNGDVNSRPCHLYGLVDNAGPGCGVPGSRGLLKRRSPGLWKRRSREVCGKHGVPGPVGFCEKYRLQTEVRVKRMQGVE